MIGIENAIFPIGELITSLGRFANKVYGVSKKDIRNSISNHIEKLRDDLYVYLEYPYIDKVYRSSYYLYYSTKLHAYSRDCIRLSFFDKEVKLEDFRDYENNPDKNIDFLGYIVIRPTFSNLIGRSIISPKALKSKNFICCLVKNEVSVNGRSFTVSGFPHSSQDEETITCAETTIWSIMEFFGNSQSDYKPILPATIISTMSNISHERVIPSHGLTAEQLSYSLKAFGFGVRTYNAEVYKKDFKRFLYYYVESGIPIIATIENRKLGHAVVVIGHEDPIDKNAMTSTDISFSLKRRNRSNIDVIDTADIEKKFVFIDDNYPPYYLSNFDSPTIHYREKVFRKTKITNIIVPLHPKVYLEAHEARVIFHSILQDPSIFEYDSSDSLMMRMFLVSSKKYKEKIACDTSLTDKIKDYIISISMPLFIWVSEYSSIAQYTSTPPKCSSIIAIDATETNKKSSLLFVLNNGFIMSYNKRKFTKDHANVGDLSIFRNNLKKV